MDIRGTKRGQVDNKENIFSALAVTLFFQQQLKNFDEIIHIIISSVD